MSRTGRDPRESVREFMESLATRSNVTPAARLVLDEDPNSEKLKYEIARRIYMREGMRGWGKIAERVDVIIDFYSDDDSEQIRDMSHRDRIRLLHELFGQSQNFLRNLNEAIRTDTESTGMEKNQNIINILAFSDDGSALTSEEAHLQRKSRQRVRGFISDLLLSAKGNDDKQSD